MPFAASFNCRILKGFIRGLIEGKILYSEALIPKYKPEGQYE